VAKDIGDSTTYFGKPITIIIIIIIIIIINIISIDAVFITDA